jgi:hypothetical protein
LTHLVSFIFSDYFSKKIFTIYFETSKSFFGRRSFTLSSLIKIGKNSYHFTLPPRGVYFSGEASLKITDIAGFFSFSIKRPNDEIPENLIVYPACDFEISLSVPENNTSLSNGANSFKRSEELYDLKSYFPGDDPRKINWPLYAHTGNFFIRQGELLPPPYKKISIYINTFFLSLSSDKYIFYFDLLINRLNGFIQYLLARKIHVSIYYYDSNGILKTLSLSVYSLSFQSLLLGFLSGPQLDSNSYLSHFINSFSKDSSFLYIFTLPAKNLEIHRLLSSRLSLVFGPKILPIKTEKKINLFTRFLFYDTTRSVLSFDFKFNSLLLESISVFKKRGFYVQEI